MQIDWFTLVAEIINFLILLWLLQRFLYRPVVNAMEKREQTIANHLREAELQQRQAEEEVEKYQAMQREFDAQRDQMVQTARQEAEAHRTKLLEEMRAEAEEARRSWQLAVQQEKAAFLNELERRVGESAVEIARHVLANMADGKLEAQVVRTFVRRLDDASDEMRDQIAQALHSQTVRIDSAFELAQDERAQIEEELRGFAPDGAGSPLKPDYRVVRDLLCGLRLITGEYELSWTFGDYTTGLRAQFNHAIEEGMDESVLDAAMAQIDIGPESEGEDDHNPQAEKAGEENTNIENADTLDVAETSEDGASDAAKRYGQEPD